VTDSAQDWLPDAALVEPKLIARLDAAIAAWSAKWFGDRTTQRFGSAEAARQERGPAAVQRRWSRFGAGIWLDWGSRTGLALARHALALGDNQPKAYPADDRLLSYYAERIARELAQAISDALGTRGTAAGRADAAAPGPGIELKLRTRDEGPSLHLLVENAELVSSRKKLCPAWKSAAVESQPLSRALAEFPVDIEASLGNARMSALDLRNIAVGDIVVLERATTDPVLLRSIETGTVVGGVRLVREDENFLLKAS